MALLALVPFAAKKVNSLMIFSVFVLLWLFGSSVRKLPKFWLPLWARFVGVGLLFSALTEYFVFQEHPGGLFSSNLGAEIFLAMGIYGSLLVIWYFLLKRYQFSLWQQFFSAGLWGVVFEQNFRVLLSFNLLGYLLVFLVYGSVMAIPHIFYGQEFDAFPKKEGGKKYLMAFLFQCFGYLGGFLWIAIFRTLLHIK